MNISLDQIFGNVNAIALPLLLCGGAVWLGIFTPFFLVKWTKGDPERMAVGGMLLGVVAGFAFAFANPSITGETGAANILRAIGFGFFVCLIFCVCAPTVWASISRDNDQRGK